MIVEQIERKCNYYEICKYYMDTLDVCIKYSDAGRVKLCQTFGELIETKRLRPEIDALLT